MERNLKGCKASMKQIFLKWSVKPILGHSYTVESDVFFIIP